MNKIYKLLYLLPLLILVACSSDKDVELETEDNASAVQTYTMTGCVHAISRVTYSDVANKMTCDWEIGDIVVLKNSSSEESYNFTVVSIDDDGVATMTHKGAISEANSFTGTATYAPRDAEKAGVQTSNGNTEHLKYGETMVATLDALSLPGAHLNFSHPETAVYKVTFKAPVDFTSGSTLTMAGAWDDPAVLTLGFGANANDIVTAFIIYGGGSLAADTKLGFTLSVNGGNIYNYTFAGTNTLTYDCGKYWLADITEKTMEEIVANGPVDLGLPSGTMWASCNIGASSPEEHGDYYAWGETNTKDNYSSSNSSTYGKTIAQLTSDGIIDSDGNLTATYDVASVKLGVSWRMPTLAEFQELMNKCTWTWTIVNGVSGYKVTGPNGNSIFLPVTGWCSGSSFFPAKYNGLYWSSTPDENNSRYAYYLLFSSDEYRQRSYYRYCGQSVRPVLVEKKSTIEPVDLGLPSGIKWANCNIGASSPEDYGDYYAWGETETKTEYSWATYLTYLGGTMTGSSDCGTDKDPLKDYVIGGSNYNVASTAGQADGIGGTQYDVAHVKWGGRWRMPTKAEILELRNNCTWTWTTIAGVKGYEVKSKTNGNSIFLPATGYRIGTSLVNAGDYGYCWSSTPHESNSIDAYNLYFDSDGDYWGGYYRYLGQSVRPVSE